MNSWAEQLWPNSYTMGSNSLDLNFFQQFHFIVFNPMSPRARVCTFHQLGSMSCELWTLGKWVKSLKKFGKSFVFFRNLKDWVKMQLQIIFELIVLYPASIEIIQLSLVLLMYLQLMSVEVSLKISWRYHQIMSNEDRVKH